MRGAVKKINEIPRAFASQALKNKATDRLLFYVFYFFSLRFWLFLGMRNPETAKKLFWIFLEFFGHDPKSHLMTQKNIFLGTCSVRPRPY